MLWLRPLQFEQWRIILCRRALSCGLFSTLRVCGPGTGTGAVLGVLGMIRTLSVLRFRSPGTESGLVMSLLGTIRGINSRCS